MNLFLSPIRADVKGCGKTMLRTSPQRFLKDDQKGQDEGSEFVIIKSGLTCMTKRMKSMINKQGKNESNIDYLGELMIV